MENTVKKEVKEMSIWIIGEKRNGNIPRVVDECIGAGERLASKLNCNLNLILLGENLLSISEKLTKGNLTKVYLLESKELAKFSIEKYSEALAQFMRPLAPKYIILGATYTGRDLSPALASRLEGSLINDVLEIKMQEEITFIRPLYAGKILAEVKPTKEPVILTLRPNVFPLPSLSEKKFDIETISINYPLSDRTKVVKQEIKEKEEPDVSEATVVVSGGRGMKGSENFSLLTKFARLLGGAVGASRAAVDSGWMPHHHQVGQTGKIISPNLYIACGISGAIQHLVGISSAKCVIAINKDPEANIFKVADYGIVGDVFEVLPIFIKILENGGGGVNIN